VAIQAALTTKPSATSSA
jgi:hypothetical protein